MSATFPKIAPEWTVDEQEDFYAFRRSYEAVKESVSLADVLATLTDEEIPAGRKAMRCPLPDHEDKTPSCVVYPDESWHCFGCLRGGDVIDLWQLVHGMASSWEAVVGLSVVFGVDLPDRSQGWKDARSRRERMRDVHVKNVASKMSRRTFDVHAMEAIESIEDPTERESTLQEWWTAWNKHLPFYAWAAALVSRCEERKARSESGTTVPDLEDGDGAG